MPASHKKIKALDLHVGEVQSLQRQFKEAEARLEKAREAQGVLDLAALAEAAQRQLQKDLTPTPLVQLYTPSLETIAEETTQV